MSETKLAYSRYTARTLASLTSDSRNCYLSERLIHSTEVIGKTGDTKVAWKTLRVQKEGEKDALARITK